MFRKAAITLALVALLAPWAGTAAASPIFIQSPASTFYQQTQNSPCVIGDESCKGALLYTHLALPAYTPGGAKDYADVPSPVYSFADLAGPLQIAGTSGAFIVGVDVNWAGNHAGETLTRFDILVDGVTLYNLAAPFQYAYSNNGNGYSDALIYQNSALAGFPISTGHTYQFILTSINGGDGLEEYFLINTASPPPVVPEPASMVLLGTGLVGLAYRVRRRK
jgi:hypothetical protein